MWLCGSRDYYVESNQYFETHLSSGLFKDTQSICDIFLATTSSRCPAVILNREMAMKAGAFDEKLSHFLDIDLFLRISFFGGLQCNSTILANYRVYSASASGVNESNKTISSVESLKQISDIRCIIKDKTKSYTRTKQFCSFARAIEFGTFRYLVRRHQYFRAIKVLLIYCIWVPLRVRIATSS